MAAESSLDSLLEAALAGSAGGSAGDAVVLALHSCLLSAGYLCISTADEVGVN